MIPNVKIRPIGIALLVFIILYIGLNVFAHFTMPFRAPDSNGYMMVLLFGFFPWLVAGYVAASLAKNHGIFHSALLGPLTSLIQQIDCFVKLPTLLHACTLANWFYYLVYGVVLSGIGGFVWYLKKIIQKRQSSLTKS